MGQNMYVFYKYAEIAILRMRAKIKTMRRNSLPILDDYRISKVQSRSQLSLRAGQNISVSLERSHLSSFVVLFTMLVDRHAHCKLKRHSSVTSDTFCRFATY